ncbi:Threonine-phosphate decarboxylase [Raoultella ornithinolytica]|nr:Threonine-phosphate decarboxylase [Raoultella ornithinolytica]
MKRLLISFLTSRDLSPFYSIIRISGCSAHSPNSTPFPALRLGYLVNSDERAVARLREKQMPWSINAFAALARGNSAQG